MYQQANEHLTKQIRQIFVDSKGIFGAPKIWKELLKLGERCSLKRVQRLMRKSNLRSKTVRKYRPQGGKKIEGAYKNLLDQDFSTNTINEKWVSDITYIHTLKHGWCYLASVMDLHTRKIIGYSFSQKMTTDIVVDALNKAIQSQNPGENVIVHTDLGSQYTSKEFQEELKKNKMMASFSKRGCPYDNACIESFHAILKKEEVYCTHYETFDMARVSLFQYIEAWYNRKRPHGSIGGLTPDAYENICRKAS